MHAVATSVVDILLHTFGDPPCAGVQCLFAYCFAYTPFTRELWTMCLLYPCGWNLQVQKIRRIQSQVRYRRPATPNEGWPEERRPIGVVQVSSSSRLGLCLFGSNHQHVARSEDLGEIRSGSSLSTLSLGIFWHLCYNGPTLPQCRCGDLY